MRVRSLLPVPVFVVAAFAPAFAPARAQDRQALARQVFQAVFDKGCPVCDCPRGS